MSIPHHPSDKMLPHNLWGLPDSYNGYFSAHVFPGLHVALYNLGLPGKLPPVSRAGQESVSPVSREQWQSLLPLLLYSACSPEPSISWFVGPVFPGVHFVVFLLSHVPVPTVFTLCCFCHLCARLPSPSLHLNPSSGHLSTVCLSLYFHYLNWSISIWNNFMSKGHVGMSRHIFDCYNLCGGTQVTSH